MAYYRVYLLNDTDRIFDYEAIERASDDAAVLAAAMLGVCSPAVEIWAGAPAAQSRWSPPVSRGP